MDVRDNIFNIKISVKWKGSIILFLCEFISWLLQFFSVMVWWGQIRCWIGRTKPFPKMVTELWLIVVLLIQFIILATWRNVSETGIFLYFLVPLWLLADSLSATLRDVFLAPNVHDGSVQVYNRQRWLLLTLISIIEIILSFAILILYYRSQFHLPILDALTAVYVSTVTFLTLGYGEFYPTHCGSKVVVLGELGFFLLFLALKLPLAVGMIIVKDYKEDHKTSAS